LKLFKITGFWSALRAACGWLLLLIGLFFAAAYIGSSIPANNDWQQPENGIPIFVETNGVHVSIIVPIAAAGEDLSDLIRPDQLSDPMLYGTHVMVGWGHGAVYRETKTWSDVKVKNIASAVFGSDFTTLHVYHLTNPQPTAYRKKLRVSLKQYHAIISQIRATFRLDKQGRSVATPAYGPDNLFYDSYGHYNALHTCNNWTGDILRKAGIRIGIWTPMPGGVMKWF
jgi:uncharacterized protein (TIGR02117 family)